MALQVWLPLNGSTEQNGLAPINMIGLPSAWEDGPIGKAAVFNKTTANAVYNTSKSFDYLTNFSVAFWVKNNYDSGTQYAWTVGRADAGGYGYGCLAYASSLNLRFGSAINYSIPITSNTWTHLVMTVSQAGGSINFYKDGTLYATVAYPLSGLPTYSDGNGLGLGCFHYSGNIYPWLGSLCDFRIYNHVLSLKEIQQIYQRLFLHYPLDNNGIGQPNLLSNTKTFKGFSIGSGWVKSTETDGTVVYHFERAATTSPGWVRIIPPEHFTSADYPNGITVSLDFKTPSVANIQRTTIIALQNYLSNGSRIGWVEWNNPDLSQVINNQWTRIKVFFPASALENVSTGSYTAADVAYTTLSFQLVQGGSIYIKNIKAEPGNVANPYYSISNADANLTSVYYDTSGYKHNATIVGALTYNSETPRYKVSTLFDSPAKYMYAPKLRLQRPMTWCCWYKHDGSTSHTWRFLVSEGRDNQIDGASLVILNGKFEFRSPNNDLVATTTLSAGWHHLCAVLDNSTVKLYIDGILNKTLNSSNAITYTDANSPAFVVGKMSYTYTSSTSYFPAMNLMSDVRIYKSALSADEVKELYETSMVIDANGNILSRTLSV